MKLKYCHVICDTEENKKSVSFLLLCHFLQIVVDWYMQMHWMAILKCLNGRKKIILQSPTN